MRRLYLFLIIISSIMLLDLFSSFNSFAQKNINNPNITYEKNEFGKISKIYFSVNGTKKVFDVYKNNPYDKLSYKKDRLKKGHNVYMVDNIPMSKILPNYKSQNYSEKNIGDVKITSIYSTSFVKGSKNNNYQIIGYQLKAFREGGEIAGLTSSLLIIDSILNITIELKDVDVNTNEVGITDDGRFLFITYGYEIESGIFMKYGYRIYDLLKNKIIVQQSDGNSYVGLMAENMMIFGYDLYNESNQILTKIVVYDMYNNKKYSRTFNYDEQDIIEITPKGYIINFNNQKKLLSFKNDFINESL